MAVQLTSAAHLLLYNEENALLMIRRFNTGYEDGNFSVVAGHLESYESARMAMQREAKEEANIEVDPADLEFVHVMYRQKPDGQIKADFFFRCTKWSGQVEIAEPDKCDLMGWYLPDALPANTIPYIRAALANVHDDQRFSEFGWSELVLDA